MKSIGCVGWVKRRELLAGILAGVTFSTSNALLWWQAQRSVVRHPGDSALSGIDTDDDIIVGTEQNNQVQTRAGDQVIPLQQQASSDQPPLNSSYLDKVRFFEREFEDDIYLPKRWWPVLQSVLIRFEQVQRIVGHGNYNLISFDQLLKHAKSYSSVGEFTPPELEFMEMVFFTEARQYGFLGRKVTEHLTTTVSPRETYKVPHSGHFLFKGFSLEYYEKLKRDVGSSIILTSGIRSNVKQMHLFLAKCARSAYNLSKASRSLAPPGHSYHGIGDFDVGRIGWGFRNFTDQFARTEEFRRMQDLGYVKIRYTENNRLGVRFEPWHIKVV